ncbi:MAG: DUF1449 domain-containing protein [Candidatus Adiutrix sp.]|jgi:hypothetical protein|nr:DUF1449 domain-containing protein [Candidatus Adiutrix sp.]
MAEFLDNCLSFPVVVFSGALVIAALYWVVAAFGLLGVDVLDGTIEVDGDIGLDAGDIGLDDFSGLDAAPGAAEAGFFAGVLQTMKLKGVPLTLVLTFIALLGWLITYYAFYFGLKRLASPGLMRYALGLPVFLAALFAAARLTALVIKPFQVFFKKISYDSGEALRGRTVIVRTLKVTSAFGEAAYDDGAAGLQLEVRVAEEGGRPLTKGDRAIILDYDREKNVYIIVGEDEFRGRRPE